MFHYDTNKTKVAISYAISLMDKTKPLIEDMTAYFNRTTYIDYKSNEFIASSDSDVIVVDIPEILTQDASHVLGNSCTRLMSVVYNIMQADEQLLFHHKVSESIGYRGGISRWLTDLLYKDNPLPPDVTKDTLARYKETINDMNDIGMFLIEQLAILPEDVKVVPVDDPNIESLIPIYGFSKDVHFNIGGVVIAFKLVNASWYADVIARGTKLRQIITALDSAYKLLNRLNDAVENPTESKFGNTEIINGDIQVIDDLVTRVETIKKG